ncbi:hypothetical protein SAMN04489731_1155 [Amycolatopsis regifaucium]|nr:hypothetical protein SAMN04489731_1155 [Amycolatopsis regifaucium]
MCGGAGMYLPCLDHRLQVSRYLVEVLLPRLRAS